MTLGLVHGCGKKSEVSSPFHLWKNRPKKVLCDLLDKKTSLSSLSSPYKNIDLSRQISFFFSKRLVHRILFRQKDQEKVFCSRTVLRKQDAVGAYIWASIKMLIGGAEILCVF